MADAAPEVNLVFVRKCRAIMSSVLIPGDLSLIAFTSRSHESTAFACLDQLFDLTLGVALRAKSHRWVAKRLDTVHHIRSMFPHGQRSRPRMTMIVATMNARIADSYISTVICLQGKQECIIDQG